MSEKGERKIKKKIELHGIDSVILGQIMAAQNILFALPTRKKITDFYANLLSSIPGVKSCQVCLGNSYTQVGEINNQKCSICENITSSTDEDSLYSKDIFCKLKLLKHSYVFALDTIDHRFGFFVFIIDQPGLFELYKPFVNNLGNFVALSLENRLQKNNLQKAHDELEKKVKERTAELNNSNIQLENELNEKKRTEQRLESQYALLSSLINSSQNIIIFSLDKNYCYTAFNEKHFGEMKRIWNVEIKIGMNLLDCITIPELKKLAKNSIDRTLKGETVSEIQHQPSAEVYYEFIWNPVIQNKEIIGIIAFILDITEREKSKIKILESEQLFRALVENSPDFIARYDREFRRIYVNPAIQKLFRDKAEDILGKTPSDQSPLFAPKIYIDHLQKVFETADESVAEIPFKTSKGIMHWGHMRFVPEFDADGKVATVMAIGRDIHEIKENEQRFRMLADNFPDFVIRFDRECRYIYINPAVEEAFGMLSEKFIGKTIQELPLHRNSELNNLIFTLIKRAFNEDTIIDSETFLDLQNGERLFELRYVPEKDATGNVVSVLSIARDITERKKAEEKILRSEQRLRLHAEQSPLGFLEWDENFCAIEWNAACEQIFGYTREEAIGRHAKDLILTEEVKGFVDEIFNNLMNQTGGQHSIDKNITKDGRIIICEWFNTALVNNKGRAIAVASICNDITERKHMEEALKAREREFRSLAENSPDNIIRYDRQCRAVYCNKKIFTTERDEILGKTPLELGAGGLENDTKYEKHIIQVLQSGKSSELELVLHWFNGQLKNHLIRFVPELDIEGNISGVLVIGQDITERKRTEEALAAREREFRTLAENSPDNIARYDANCRTIYVNPNLEKTLRISAAEMLGTIPAEAKYVKEFKEYNEKIVEVLKTGIPTEIDLIYPDLKEEKHYYNVRFVAERGAGGSIEGVLAIGRDVTEHKRNEALNQSRLHIIQFAETHSLDEILEETLNEVEKLTGSKIGFYHFVNDDQKSLTFQNWSTRTKAEFCKAEGKGLHFPIDEAGVWVDCVSQRKPVIHNDYASLPHRKGMPEGHAEVIRELVVPVFRGEKLLAILGTGNKLTDYNEKDIEVVSLMAELTWEITERKRAEEALKAREIELQNLADSSPGLMGTFYLKPDGSVCMPYTSPQLQELFGLDPEDVIDDATPLLSRTHPDDMQLVNDTIAESAKTMTPWHCEYRVIHPTKGELWLEGSTNPKPHPGGGIIWYGFIHDITKRKVMENEISKLNEELEQRVINRTLQLEAANKELEAFAYSVSHDLRAPLRGIDGFSLVLLEDYQKKLDAEGRDYLYRVRAAAQRMAQLIDDLLTLSKISRDVMNIGAVNLSKIAQKIINTFKESQPKRKVKIKIQDGIIAKGDERLIQIALQNLIENAWKFTSKHEKAYIEFGMLKEKGKSIYFIRDDGAGFDMKYSQKLFGAFQRFHTSNEFPGTGIGLATVQRIIHRHGGKIWAKSEVEKGSTFYFTIEEG